MLTRRDGTVFAPDGVAVGFVGFDDFEHEGMPDNIAAAERVKIDARNVLENAANFEQAALFGPREIDLRDVARDDHPGFFAEAGEKHHHLLGGGILRLVEDDEGIGERASAHVGERGNFDDAFFGEARDVGRIEHVVQGIVQRTQVRENFFLEIAREETQRFARFDGGAGENDALDFVFQQRRNGRGHREVSLARAGGTDAEDHGILQDRLQVKFLAERFRHDRLAVGGDDERCGVKRFEIFALAAGKGFQKANEIRCANGETLAARGMKKVKKIDGEGDRGGGRTGCWFSRDRRGRFDFEPIFARDQAYVQ